MTKKELANKEKYDLADLCAIVDILRAPDGCPWDRAQTHTSLRNNFLEEAYEVVEGIDRGDDAILREELGDVLLQVLFHAGMARDRGAFDLNDVADGVARKMVRRHPHIFAGETVAEEKLQDKWDEIKKKEKGARSKGDTLRAVSKSLPALMRAEKIAEKSGGALLREAAIPADSGVLQSGEALYRAALQSLKAGVSPEEALQKYLNALIDDPASKEKKTEKGLAE